MDDSDGLGIFGNADVRTVIGDYLLNGISTGIEVLTDNETGCIRDEGRSFYFVTVDVSDDECPSLKRAAGGHGLYDFDFAVLGVDKGDIHIFVGQNFKLFNGLVHKPVLIFKAAFGVSGFFCIIDAGVKVYTDLAVSICGSGSHLLCTFFIGVNGDLPAFKGLAGIGRLMEPAQSLLTVMPSIFCGLACDDRDGVVSQLAVPVVVTVGKLQNGIAAGLEFAGAGIPSFVGGVVAHDIPI